MNGVRTITVDVEAPSVETAKITKNTDGSVTGPAGETLTKALKDAKDALAKLPKDADAATVKAAQDKVNAAQKAIDDSPNSNKVATAQNVAEAINNSGWRTNSTTATGGAKDTLINPGKAVNFESGKNMEVAQTVDKDGNVAYTYKTKDDVQFNSVQLGGDTGPKLTNDGNDLKVSGSNGTPVKITNVADGNISADSKDAVNGSQLHATNEKVANLGTTVNNLGDKVNNLGDTVNNLSGELNKGWSLQANGKDVTAVTSGKGVNFASADDSVTITPEVDSNGIAKVNLTVNTANVIDKNKGSIKEAATDPKADKAGQVTVTGTPVRKADGSMETQKEANAREGNKLATVENVVKAINSAATFVKVADSQEVITASTADDNGVAVKSGDTVTHTAGKNLKVKRDGKSVTYALAQDIDVNSVKATNGVTIGSGDNATTITSNDKGLNLAGKDGAATNINNVKDADLNATSKQAVNGSQLHATNQKVAGLEGTVNNLSNVINHHAGAIDSLDRKVNKHSKQARAGIAGANAAAALPQAYTQGKAMVAAAAGTFKGQNALAVGYSRISDNGKVILKLQGNANTSGDVGAGVGVGYQW